MKLTPQEAQDGWRLVCERMWRKSFRFHSYQLPQDWLSRREIPSFNKFISVVYGHSIPPLSNTVRVFKDLFENARS